MTPRRRHKTDFNSSMRPRMLLLAMLKTMKQLLQNLKLPKRKSRRSRKCSTLRQPMLISRRDRTFLRRAPTLSMDSLIPSMPIWLPCPSPFLRTRRKLLQRKLQLSRTSLRSMDVLPPQSRRLKILLLTRLLLTTPLRQLIHGKMLQQLNSQTSRKLLELCSLKIELQEPWISRKTLQPSSRFSSNAQQQSMALLPQGDKVPADAQVFKDELARITKYVTELQANTKIE